MIELGLYDFAQDALKEVFRRYTPLAEEKEYGKFLAHTSHFLEYHLNSLITITKIYELDELKLHNPDLYIYYPRPFFENFQQQAQLKKIDPYLLLAIARQESAFNVKAKSGANALGLLQIIPRTGKRIAEEVKHPNFKEEHLLSPEINIRFSAHYVDFLSRRYQKNLIYTVAAYNAGEEAVDSWVSRRKQISHEAFIETIPFGQTRKYVKKVLRNRMNYYLLYEKEKAFKVSYFEHKMGEK